MNDEKKIKSALISVFSKEGLEQLISLLNKNEVEIYSTGGTQKYIENLGFEVVPVENLTEYPSILGGRVKTLHPKVFGGILNRRKIKSDQYDIEKYAITEIDLVVVDLYPFEQALKNNESESNIIENIDIGGISLIRAAANIKNLDILSHHGLNVYDVVKKDTLIIIDNALKFVEERLL